MSAPARGVERESAFHNFAADRHRTQIVISDVLRKREAEIMSKESAPQLTPLSICKSLFAGGFAGGLSRTAVAPLERLKIVMQVQSVGGQAAKYTGIWQGLKHMAQTEGLKGLFKGNGTNCVRIVPNSAVKFFMYENFSRQYLTYLQRSNPGPWP
ncbi:hypothetical protein CYMTET_29846 [Cymbomonas tetramitiformis]|uniref:Uncharacterized protein n=1 Tax=Cymbomonas tetramitiformis TaxID=36881 RepID=A0AAE0FKH0_9CHLO|nr:hypothetical protein CYMTET_29846 [Cymbomonas tetramitiformis]